MDVTSRTGIRSDIYKKGIKKILKTKVNTNMKHNKYDKINNISIKFILLILKNRMQKH